MQACILLSFSPHDMASVLLVLIAGGPVGATPNGGRRSLFELPNCKGSIEVREEGDLPSASEFARLYQDSDRGFGKPVIFKGAAKQMPAMRRWRDDSEMLRRYGNERLDMVEFAKKETRLGGGDAMTVREFLAVYNRTDVYAVSPPPKRMGADVHVLPFLACSYGTDYLDIANIWWGSNGIESVIHNDDQDNVNCLFSGRKRMIFWHPEWKKNIETHRCGWVDTDIERQTDPGYQAYGAFGGRIDVDAVDLGRYPSWGTMPWWDAQMEPGDCLFIPTMWYHQVKSTGRSLAANVWWWRRDQRQPGDFEQCPRGGASSSAPPLTLQDCTWHYEGPTDAPAAKTRCKGKARPTGNDHAFASVSKFHSTRVSVDCDGACPLPEGAVIWGKTVQKKRGPLSHDPRLEEGAVQDDDEDDGQDEDDERRDGDDDDDEDGRRDEL